MAANRSAKERNRLCRKAEKKEERELKRDEERKAKREEEAMWSRIRRSCEAEDDVMREVNRRAMDDKARADRAVEWTMR